MPSWAQHPYLFSSARHLLTLVHWIFVNNNIGGALVHFLPLGALQVYRAWKAGVGSSGSRLQATG